LVHRHCERSEAIHLAGTVEWIASSLPLAITVLARSTPFAQNAGMTLKLFELVGTDEARPFSPFCWRTRMALAH
jgi:hypothetical protein